MNVLSRIVAKYEFLMGPRIWIGESDIFTCIDIPHTNQNEATRRIRFQTSARFAYYGETHAIVKCFPLNRYMSHRVRSVFSLFVSDCE